MNKLQFTATTFYGLEKILADELLQLGARHIHIGNRSVYFEGDLGFMYKANFNLHLALRVLLKIESFKAIYKANQLYNAIDSIDWSQYFSVEQTFRIDVTGQSKYFKNSKFIALKAKDAIVDQFRKKYQKRPDIDLKDPFFHIVLHFNEERMTVLLDSSGEPLYKRGYRIATNQAPLNEVLAAGIVALSGWNSSVSLLDPMCGSGTLLIESAMWDMRIPAAINRKKFAFQNWKNYDEELFKLIQKSSFKRIKELAYGAKLTGYDIDSSAVNKAIKNVKNAGLDEFIRIKQADFFKTNRSDDKLQLLFNPPYDERLKIDINSFYGQIGSTLKHRYPGTVAWLLSGNLSALKNIGLRPDKKIKLFNGKLESRLVRYSLYEGSKKINYNPITSAIGL